MKKKLIIIVMLLFMSLLLTACDKKEGKLIEICDIELQQSFSEKDFILAVVDEDNSMNSDFMNSLETYAKESKKTIYYVDRDHLGFTTEEILYETYKVEYALTYSVFKDGELVESNEYSNLINMRYDLKQYDFDDEIEMISQDTIDKAISRAQEELSNNNLNGSLAYLSTIWSKKEAKEMFENNPYYYFVNQWDYYEVDGDYKVYGSLKAYQYINQLYIAETKDKNEYVKPESSEYKIYDYYVENGIIYISENNTKYTEYARILYASRKSLVLKINGVEHRYMRDNG